MRLFARRSWDVPKKVNFNSLSPAIFKFYFPSYFLTGNNDETNCNKTNNKTNSNAEHLKDLTIVSIMPRNYRGVLRCGRGRKDAQKHTEEGPSEKGVLRSGSPETQKIAMKTASSSSSSSPSSSPSSPSPSPPGLPPRKPH